MNDAALAYRLLIQPMDELCDEKKEHEPSHSMPLFPPSRH
jgi:hypothetical protein